MSSSKDYICKFMQANLWHHKLVHFHFPFWIWKVWKRREKITKIWISSEQKEPFRWNKKIFSKFLKGYHLMKKIKIWWKKADTSFNRFCPLSKTPPSHPLFLTDNMKMAGIPIKIKRKISTCLFYTVFQVLEVPLFL